MNSKQFLKYIFVTLLVVLTVKTSFGQDTTGPKQVIKARLTVPFGTLAKMSVEIVDGNELNEKGHQSSFLLRVKSIDNTPLSKPIIIEFKDETGNFPTDDFELYKHLYGKKTRTISSKETEKMKKKYVGRQFNIVAYETGGFTGIPDDYFKYQPVKQDYEFHFRHYIIVVADLTKTTE
jgi:hypothetical protein